jgi:hypothetical protein
MHNDTSLITYLFNKYVIPSLLVPDESGLDDSVSYDLNSPIGQLIIKLQKYIINNVMTEDLFKVETLSDLEILLEGMDQDLQEEFINSAVVSSVNEIWRRNDTRVLDHVSNIKPDISYIFDDEPVVGGMFTKLLKKWYNSPVVHIQFEDDDGRKTRGEIIGDRIKCGDKSFSNFNSFGRYAMGLGHYENLSGRDCHRIAFKCGQFVQRYHEVLSGINLSRHSSTNRIKQVYDYMTKGPVTQEM